MTLHAMAGPVHLLTIDREHEVGVLLDRTEPPEVVQRGTGIRPSRAVARQLGRHEQGDIPLDRQSLQRPHRERDPLFDAGRRSRCGRELE